MTVSIWYKVTVVVYNYIAASGSQFQQGFSFRTNPNFTTLWADTVAGRYYVKSSTILTAGHWFLLTGTYHENNGANFYINRVMDPGLRRLDINSDINEVDWRAHTGVKDGGSYSSYPTHGTVDESKYYYRLLNPTGRLKYLFIAMILMIN